MFARVAPSTRVHISSLLVIILDGIIPIKYEFFYVAGKRIDGIWHTSIVLFGKEYFYGQSGITWCDPVSKSQLKIAI